MASTGSETNKDNTQSNMEVEELKREVERISRELDQAVAEKIQSAKYGLGLLDETNSLKQRCEQLENLYENTRHELDITQEVCIASIVQELLSIPKLTT